MQGLQEVERKGAQKPERISGVQGNHQLAIKHKRFGDLVKLPNPTKMLQNDMTFFGKYININPIENPEPKSLLPFVVSVDGKEYQISMAFVKGCLLTEKMSRLKRGIAYLCMIGITRKQNYQGFCHTREGRGRELLLSKMFSESDATLLSMYWVCRRLCVKDFRCKNIAECCVVCFPEWCKRPVNAGSQIKGISPNNSQLIVPVQIPNSSVLFANVAAGQCCQLLVRLDSSKNNSQGLKPDLISGVHMFFCIDRPAVLKMLYSNGFLETLKRNDHSTLMLALRLFGVPDKSVVSDLEKFVDTLYKLNAGQPMSVQTNKMEDISQSSSRDTKKTPKV